MPVAAAPESFADLVHRAFAGCQDATRELYDRLGEEIIRRIRRKLKASLRRVLDAEDVCQVAWLRCCWKASRDRRFDTPEQLLAYLSAVAGHCLADESRDDRPPRAPGRRLPRESRVCRQPWEVENRTIRYRCAATE